MKIFKPKFIADILKREKKISCLPELCRHTNTVFYEFKDDRIRIHLSSFFIGIFDDNHIDNNGVKCSSGIDLEPDQFCCSHHLVNTITHLLDKEFNYQFRIDKVMYLIYD